MTNTSSRTLSPKDKRLKKKEAYVKAKKDYENFLNKRKVKIAEMLFKVDENIGDYDNAVLKNAFTDLAGKLKNEI